MIVRLASLALLLATTGCATSGPAFPDPGAPRPDATASVIGGARWWTAFGDPGLTRVVERSLAGNLDIEAAAARLDQSLAAARATRASLLPSIGATGSVGVSRQSLEDPAIAGISAFPGFERDAARFDAGLSASWEIDLFGARPRVAGARARAAASLSDLEAARVAVAAQTASAYLNLRELQERRAIGTDRLASLNRQLGAVRLRVQAGVAARIELDRLTGEAESAAAQLPVLSALIAGELARLAVLVGDRSVQAELAVPALLPGVPTTAASVGDVALSIAGRPDILAADRRLTAAGADIDVERSRRYPRFSLASLIGLIAGGPLALFGADALSGSARAGVSLPIFDFGRIDAAIAQATGRRREALSAYRAAVLRAATEVDEAAETLTQRRAEIARRDAAAAALGRARRIATLTYDAGASDLTSLLDTERADLTAREGATQARAAAARALVALFRATAGASEPGASAPAIPLEAEATRSIGE